MERPSQTHSIRLRGPWQRSAGARFCSESSQRVQLPQQCLPSQSDDAAVTSQDLSSGSGAADGWDHCYRRSFNCPTGLQGSDRVDLVVQAIDHLVAIRLNDAIVWQVPADAQAGDARGVRVPITEQLQPHNQLDLQLRLPSPALPCLTGSISLEIVSSLS
ncbi:hypothetical protein [Roseimaritima multifibrata]|nr:hypothetical protein [Roseimaritima multifibrata]